jgi:manganese oxidase
MKLNYPFFRHTRHLRQFSLRMAILTALMGIIFAVPAAQGPQAVKRHASGNIHHIDMTAHALENGQLAYQMLSHEIEITHRRQTRTVDMTAHYSSEPSIPGPTLVISEGDEVFLTIYNDIDEYPDEQVSVHVHGVHYEIDSDGTLKPVNRVSDQGAYPNGDSYTYHWIAAPGTAGTWPYPDHNFGDINGAEHKGLFGAVIVNPASGKVAATFNHKVRPIPVSSIAKDYVLYLGDDAFWGMEIDNLSRQQRALWVNPTLVASKKGLVRFHLIALGTDFHEFELSGYRWFDPLTHTLIDRKAIGPLEHHVFTLWPRANAEYANKTFSKYLLGMKGKFQVKSEGGPSSPGHSPL